MKFYAVIGPDGKPVAVTTGTVSGRPIVAIAAFLSEEDAMVAAGELVNPDGADVTGTVASFDLPGPADEEEE